MKYYGDDFQQKYPDQEYWFEYHCLESEESADAELWHHTAQFVTILSQIPIKEAEELPMYKVQFKDGFSYDVFDDELISTGTTDDF